MQDEEQADRVVVGPADGRTEEAEDVVAADRLGGVPNERVVQSEKSDAVRFDRHRGHSIVQLQQSLQRLRENSTLALVSDCLLCVMA